MRGEIDDIVGRMKAVLPNRWFADQTPNLDAVLASLATTWRWLYLLIQYASAQTRLRTSSDFWLDLSALDYFGSRIRRKSGETDNLFRNRIQRSLFQEAGTRTAVITAMSSLTGTSPRIFEPARCSDTGAYGTPVSAFAGQAPPIAYGLTGGWGSLRLPYQFFIAVSRPPTPGISNLSGYGCSAGGYGVGQISYVDLSSVPGVVSDAEIQEALCTLIPVNMTAWLRIT